MTKMGLSPFLLPPQPMGPSIHNAAPLSIFTSLYWDYDCPAHNFRLTESCDRPMLLSMKPQSSRWYNHNLGFGSSFVETDPMSPQPWACWLCSSLDVFSRQTVGFHTSGRADRVKQMLSWNERPQRSWRYTNPPVTWLSLWIKRWNYLWTTLCWNHQHMSSCLPERRAPSINTGHFSPGLILSVESDFPNDGETVT